MSHNYYEDYKLQFQQDRREGNKPQLSELAQQGMAYCSAVLFASMDTQFIPETRHNGRTFYNPQIEDRIYGVRSRILHHDFSEALAFSNVIDTYMTSQFLDTMRLEFYDLEFDDTFQREVYKAGAMQDRSNAEDALFTIFPKAAENREVAEVMLSLNMRANKALLVDLGLSARRRLEELAEKEPDRDPFYLLQARNPFYGIIHALHFADYAALNTGNLGRVTSGRMDDMCLFTPQTMFEFKMTRSQEQRYIAFRRLHRAGICYVAQFDLYLTYLTDLCRILERALPQEAQERVQPLAQEYLELRLARSPALRQRQRRSGANQSRS